MAMLDDQCDLDIQRILRAEIRDLQHRHRVELDLVHAAYAMLSHSEAARDLPSIDCQRQLLEESPLFDEGWYLETYADVNNQGMPAAENYIRTGAFQGRDPGPDFNTTSYYLRYPDVAKAGWPALVHYEALGKAQGYLLA